MAEDTLEEEHPEGGDIGGVNTLLLDYVVMMVDLSAARMSLLLKSNFVNCSSLHRHPRLLNPPTSVRLLVHCVRLIVPSSFTGKDLL